MHRRRTDAATVNVGVIGAAWDGAAASAARPFRRPCRFQGSA